MNKLDDMKKMSAEIKQWAHKHQWLTSLAENIDEVAQIEANGRAASDRLASLMVDIETARAELKKAKTDTGNAKNLAASVIESAETLAAESNEVARKKVDSATVEAKSIVDQARHDAKNIIGQANLAASASRDEVAKNNTSIDEQTKAINKARADYDDVIESIENAKSKAKALFAGIGS